MSNVGGGLKGCGISRLPDGRSYHRQSGSPGESSQLAKMLQGKVLIPSVPKATKVNGQGPSMTKVNKIIK